MKNATLPTNAGLDFEALVEQFYQPLYRFAYSLSRNASDAADYTQQTYYLLQTKGHQVRDPEKIKSWLFTTLYREFLKKRRRVVKYPTCELDAVAHEVPTEEQDMAASIDGRGAVAALQSLEERYRAPLAMFYLEQLSYKEIAAVLDIPIGTVMSRLSRGKEQLRRALDGPPESARQPLRSEYAEAGCLPASGINPWKAMGLSAVPAPL